MEPTAEFRCGCGAVQGRVLNASPNAVNRIVCYCDDCQAFAHHLGRADLLDARGGSDLVQLAPSTLRFERGTEHITGIRLGPKGMYRWYASCCNTPLGNTLTPAIPFVGVLSVVFQHSPGGVVQRFGPASAAVLGKFANPPLPESKRAQLLLIARAIRKVLGWKLGGGGWPNPFFERGTRTPKYPVSTLSPAQRDALRPLCGPHPAASHA